MNKINRTYESLLIHILNNGYDYEDPNRKGVKRREVLNYTFRHEFKDGFPAITTKKLNYKSVVTELIWFLRSDTNIKYLVDNGCNIWNKDAYNYFKSYLSDEWHSLKSLTIEQFVDAIKNNETKYNFENYKLGDLGNIYGAQWRNWRVGESIETSMKYPEGDNVLIASSKYLDQISNLIKNLKEKPLGTQHIVNAWNVGELDNMALQPCHYGFQIVVRPLEAYTGHIVDFGNEMFSKDMEVWGSNSYGFELHWQQRSVDTFLGLPFNIASYATLALILEKITGYKALAIQGDLKKVHLYDNSFDAVIEQLSRDVDKYSCGVFDFPAFDEFEWETLDELFHKIQPEDITLEGYESYPGIKVEMLERK